jgi:hypothetical protein
MAPSWRQIISRIDRRLVANGFLVRKIVTLFCSPEHSRGNRSPIHGAMDDGMLSIPRYLCEILYVFSLMREGFLSFLCDFFSGAFKVSLRIFLHIIALLRLFPHENLSK